MARKPRLRIPSGLYHVMLRGNGVKITEKVWETGIDKKVEELCSGGIFIR